MSRFTNQEIIITYTLIIIVFCEGMNADNKMMLVNRINAFSFAPLNLVLPSMLQVIFSHLINVVIAAMETVHQQHIDDLFHSNT